MNREPKIEHAEEACVFPARLKTLLERIPLHPVTVVEAPSGFGKTTSVRAFLKEGDRANSCRRWYTCFGERPAKAWDGFCRLFGSVDLEIAGRLKNLFPLTLECLPDVAALMAESSCPLETFIVIDNYQLFETGIPWGLMEAFSGHSDENLHIVFITQPLPLGGADVRRYGRIHRIGTKDFFFDRESTARLCRMTGAKITEKDIDRIQSVSEGWVSAILLLASTYRETGGFAGTTDMDSLIEAAVWDRAPGKYREFLLAVSLLESFTPRQGAIAGGWDVLPDDIVRMLRSSFFVAYISDKGAYSIHGVLGDFLRQRFAALPGEQAAAMIRRAGEACAAESDYIEAARFFTRAGDYDSALSLPITNRYLNEQKEKEAADFLVRLVDGCSGETLQKYPFILLPFAFQFLKGGRKDHFSRMVRLLLGVLEKPGDLPEKDVLRIRGELALLLSFTEFNDIARMSARHREALSCLTAADPELPRTSVFGLTSWTFGIPSVLNLYWRERGRLDEELGLMDECMPWYVKLAGGHGTGADAMMRAEACLNRGETAEAESLGHRAMYLARSAGQGSISLSADLLFARLAILRGDFRVYCAVREHIEICGKENPDRSTGRMAELCFAELDLALGKTGGIPPWLRETGDIGRVLYVQARPYGLSLLARLLFLEKRYPELYGLAGLAMEAGAALRYEMPALRVNLLMAAAKKDEGQMDKAAEYLEEALKIGLPDGIILPFAEFGTFLVPLLQAARGNAADGRIDRAIELCRKSAAGTAAVLGGLGPGLSLLTPREREIALLAKERLSAAEIGARLYITENTVKSALKIVYGKLDVHSRGELATVEF